MFRQLDKGKSTIQCAIGADDFFNKATAYIDSLRSKNQKKSFKKEDSTKPYKRSFIKEK